MKSHFNLDCASDQLIRSAQEEEQRAERKRLFRSTRFGVSSSERVCKILPYATGGEDKFLLSLYIEGRTVTGADAEIGWRHQGLEKHLETAPWDSPADLKAFSLPFLLALEKLGHVPAPSLRQKLARLIAYESFRLRHHLEVIARVVELVGSSSPSDDLARIRDDSEIRAHLIGRAKVDRNTAISLGLTGIMLRATGLADDLRAEDESLPYHLLNFVPQTRTESDAYARFLLRFAEIEMSMTLIQRAKRLRDEQPADSTIPTPFIATSSPFAFAYIEAPEGELVVSLWAAKEGAMQRVRIKTPSFALASAIPTLLLGADIDDVALILASLGVDWVELDR